MSNPFIRKLERRSSLTMEHRRDLEHLMAKPVHLGPRENIFREGDEALSVSVMLSGWACRYKVLPDGRRQIVALFLPGDMCDPYVFLLGAMDHALATLTPVTLSKVPAQAIRDLGMGGPDLVEFLWRQALAAIEIQREWTVSLGRRDAIERLAHLFCEVAARLVAAGLSNGSECELPLTQTDLADALGLSNVHVNRSLQELRSNGLIDLRNRRLVIHDGQRLAELGMFDPAYLHQRGA